MRELQKKFNEKLMSEEKRYMMSTEELEKMKDEFNEYKSKMSAQEDYISTLEFKLNLVKESDKNESKLRMESEKKL